MLFLFFFLFFCSLWCIRFGRISQRDDGNMGWREPSGRKISGAVCLVPFPGKHQPDDRKDRGLNWDADGSAPHGGREGKDL